VASRAWIERALDELSVGHGAFARRHAEGNGVPRSAIDRRLRSGELEVLHKGIFRRRGTPDTFRQRVEAARLAVGDRAVVARRTAACLFGLLPPRDIEILTDLPRRSRAANYTLIRTKFLPDDHVVEMHGIPRRRSPGRWSISEVSFLPRRSNGSPRTRSFGA
jgi:hypothetical protein